MKIEDNFLDQNMFDELQTLMMGEEFLWSYVSAIDFAKDADKFQFVHMFYHNISTYSLNFKDLRPILEIIDPISLFKIKANLLTRTPNIVENLFHVDFSNLSEEKMEQWTTSIFYVNTNNGYTEFEDGTKVESVANRMISFPANMKHTGTSCTDEKIRIVINFNYLKIV